MKALNLLAAVLVIVGALNWGLVGAAGFNLVAAIFGSSVLASMVYIAVGVAAVYLIVAWSVARKPMLATA